MKLSTLDSNLITWLTAPQAVAYYGADFGTKTAVLAMLVSGQGDVAALAKERGVTRQAIHHHLQRARKIWMRPSSAV
jgi:hypothetical protein